MLSTPRIKIKLIPQHQICDQEFWQEPYGQKARFRHDELCIDLVRRQIILMCPTFNQESAGSMPPAPMDFQWYSSSAS